MTDSTKVGETSSGEVVNGFRSCRDLSDIIPLYTAQGIYLKPNAKIHVSINLPQLKTPGKTISTWEVKEKVRLLIRPDEFASLKVVKSTLEFIRFEGDLGDRSRLQRVLARLDGQRLNLAGFPNVLKVKAAEMKDEFPTRHSWDSYFRDAKHMNELKAGERPDTIHISGFPVKWFCEDDGKTPSELLITKIFKKWGTVKRIDVPAADPYRSRMRLGTAIQKFSYEDGIFFDAFVQYVEYMDFVRAMDALRGMKLLKKDKDKNHAVASLKVDFDKTKHMSDNSVSHREFERKRLIAQDNLAAEKLRRKEEAEAKKREETQLKVELDLKGKYNRRRMREEKRKRKALTVFRKQEEDKVSLKIAREERKLIKAQRQLESIRLLDALFDKIKLKVEKNEIDFKPKMINDKKDEKTEEKTNEANKEDPKLLKKKDKKDKGKNKKRLKKEKKKKKKVGNTDESDSDKKKAKSAPGKNHIDNPLAEPRLPYPEIYPRLPPQAWYYNSPMTLLYPPVRGLPRGGIGRKNGIRGRGRWHNNASNFQQFNPHEYNEQYYKYFANLVGQDYHAFIESDYDRSGSSSRSRSRRRSRSRSRSRSKTKSKSRSRSRSRRRRSRSKNSPRPSSKRRTNLNTRKRTKSRSKSRNRDRNYLRTRSRIHKNDAKQLDRSKQTKRRGVNMNNKESPVRVTRAKSRSISPRRKSRSSSWSLPQSPRQRSCSWSKTIDEKEKNLSTIQKKTKKEGVVVADTNSTKPG